MSPLGETPPANANNNIVFYKTGTDREIEVIPTETLKIEAETAVANLRVLLQTNKKSPYGDYKAAYLSIGEARASGADVTDLESQLLLLENGVILNELSDSLKALLPLMRSAKSWLRAARNNNVDPSSVAVDFPYLDALEDTVK